LAGELGVAEVELGEAVGAAKVEVAEVTVATAVEEPRGDTADVRAEVGAEVAEEEE